MSACELLAHAYDSTLIPNPFTHHHTQCLLDEYAPEEESSLRVRAVGRVQEGVRATVRGSGLRIRLTDCSID